MSGDAPGYFRVSDLLPEEIGISYSQFYSQFIPGFASSMECVSIPLKHTLGSRNRWFDSEIGSLYHVLSHLVTPAVFGIFELTTIRRQRDLYDQ